MSRETFSAACVVVLMTLVFTLQCVVHNGVVAVMTVPVLLLWMYILGARSGEDAVVARYRADRRKLAS